jgi:hypothetical protein
MKLTALSLLLLAAASAPAATVLVDNTVSATIASGDRANIRGFAFRPAAGGTGPVEVLTQQVELLSLSLHRPGFSDATTPLFGSAAGQITDINAPVYLKVYSSFTGGTAAGDVGTFLGASSNGISWSEVDAINGAGVSTATAAPFESFTYSFPSISLDKDTTYWAVFSETSDSSADVANFRVIVEAGAGAAGTGYLADTVQVRDTSGTARDWGVYFIANVNTVPEPSGSLLGVLAGSFLMLRRRR